VKKYIFVSDMFVQDYSGGAELTTEAIIASCPKDNQVVSVHSSKLTQQLLDKNKDAVYIICNFSDLNDKVKLYMCKNTNYSIIEYDYKFCRFRSLEKHFSVTGKECDCLKQMPGKINSAFYGYASRLWFMSAAQKKIFLSNINVLKEANCSVLSSIFSQGDLRFIESIKDNEKNNKYLVLGSNSWIKGTQECINYAKENNLQFELVQNIPYHELLIKMSTSKGLIFLPVGSDTCPRFVIEAKLLGCDIIVNDFVQHVDEKWFDTQKSCYSYLKSRSEVFWEYYA